MCITISLFNDILIEEAENFVVEIESFTPVLIIDPYANLAIITIFDVQDPQGL